MALSKKEVELLERQGLHADIRNKLSPLKNFPQIFNAWKRERNTEIKNQLFQIIKNDIKNITRNVAKICAILDHDEKKKTGQ